MCTYMISILIATYQRPLQLKRCLLSIKATGYTTYEVLIIDQSKDGRTKSLITLLNDPRLIYIHEPTINKSVALNTGIRKAKGDILAFTDDDCIVSKRWLATIQRDMDSRQHIGGVFGSTLPYHTSAHHGLYCVSTYTHKKNTIVSKPCKHSEHIGYGNNMAWRKNMCAAIRFEPWLGPNSVGQNAEDADFTLRQLIAGNKIFCDPTMVVWHDHWVNRKLYELQSGIYIHGEMACYGNLALQGWTFAKKVVCQNGMSSLREFKRCVRYTIRQKKTTADLWSAAVRFFLARVTGITVGTIYFLKNKFRLFDV